MCQICIRKASKDKWASLYSRDCGVADAAAENEHKTVISKLPVFIEIRSYKLTEAKLILASSKWKQLLTAPELMVRNARVSTRFRAKLNWTRTKERSEWKAQ